MIQSGYTKLFGTIVASTIWREDDKTRLVWITLLALSDANGYVAGSLPGLADLARVSVEDCEKAVEKLQQPDKYSRSREHEGRRIAAVEGGWLVLNRAKYRDMSTEEHRRESARLRQRRHRMKETQFEVTRDGHALSQSSPQKEKETEKETAKRIETSRSPSQHSRRRAPHRLPDTWRPSDAHQKIGQQLGVDVEHEATRFRLYWTDEVKPDWDRAFRNWLLRAQPTAKPPKAQPQTPYLTDDEIDGRVQ